MEVACVSPVVHDQEMFLLVKACGIEMAVLEGATRGCSLLETLDVRNCPRVSRSFSSVFACLICSVGNVLGSKLYCLLAKMLT